MKPKTSVTINGNFLKAQRRIHKVTQRRLGVLLGVNACTVSNWETFRHPVPRKYVEMLVKLWGHSFETFIQPPSRLTEVAKLFLALDSKSQKKVYNVVKYLYQQVHHAGDKL